MGDGKILKPEKTGGYITLGDTGRHCFCMTIACYTDFVLILNMSEPRVAKYPAGKEGDLGK